LYRFLNPLDVLFVRGNKSFGDPGSYGESLIPPRPSVAAGALRTRLLVDDGINLAAFAAGKIEHPIVGTPDRPGPFRLTAFHLARRHAAGNVEALLPLPADMAVARPHAGGGRDSGDGILFQVIVPSELSFSRTGWASSYPLPLHPVLRQRVRTKPVGGYWLTESGWRKYLQGRTDLDPAADIIHSGRLWKLDVRVGVGLDATTRAAAEGRLFSAEAIAFMKREHGADYEVGFLVAIAGLDDDARLCRGVIRLGGDGRAAAIEAVQGYQPPEADYERVAAERKCRLVLATPGIFQKGWLPDGVTESSDNYWFELHGVRGRLVAGCIPRAEVVSGWDLAKELPKAAQRAVPAGTVYWLDELEARPEDLQRLTESGLWADPCPNPQRRAEGFNRVWVASWSEHPKGGKDS